MVGEDRRGLLPRLSGRLLESRHELDLDLLGPGVPAEKEVERADERERGLERLAGGAQPLDGLGVVALADVPVEYVGRALGVRADRIRRVTHALAEVCAGDRLHLLRALRERGLALGRIVVAVVERRRVLRELRPDEPAERKREGHAMERVRRHLVEEEHRPLALALLEELLDVVPVASPHRLGPCELGVVEGCDGAALERHRAELPDQEIVVLVRLGRHRPQDLEHLRGMQAREAIAELEADVVAVQARLIELAGGADLREDVAERRDASTIGRHLDERNGDDEVVVLDPRRHLRRALREGERARSEVRHLLAGEKMLEDLEERLERPPFIGQGDSSFEELVIEARPRGGTTNRRFIGQRGDRHVKWRIRELSAAHKTRRAGSWSGGCPHPGCVSRHIRRRHGARTELRCAARWSFVPCSSSWRRRLRLHP